GKDAATPAEPSTALLNVRRVMVMVSLLRIVGRFATEPAPASIGASIRTSLDIDFALLDNDSTVDGYQNNVAADSRPGRYRGSRPVSRILPRQCVDGLMGAPRDTPLTPPSKVLASATTGVVRFIESHNGDVDAIFGRATIDLDDI